MSDQSASSFEPAATQHGPAAASGAEIEDVIAGSGGRFAAAVLAARRARQITSYFGQHDEGIGQCTPPQVSSLSRKPLMIAFEEIAQGKVTPKRRSKD